MVSREFYEAKFVGTVCKKVPLQVFFQVQNLHIVSIPVF